MQTVESGADPVKRPEQGVVKTLLLTVSGNNTIHQLLGTGIDPARLGQRPQNQRGLVRMEFTVGAHAIDFGGRWKQHPLLVLDAAANNGQVRLEIQLEHRQRILHIGRGCGNGHQWQHHVAFLYVVFNPFMVDGDITFKKVEALVVHQVGNPHRLHVHAIDMPAGRFKDQF